MVKWKIGLVIYCVLVLYMSSMSPSELSKTGVAISDKAIHLVEYAIMGIMAWGAWQRRNGVSMGLAGFLCLFWNCG